LVPLLEAEQDRDIVRKLDAMAEREASIMKEKLEWKAGDLKTPTKGVGKGGVRDENQAEPVYHTKRYVAPSLIFLPQSEPSFLSAQWWRGTKVFTKVSSC
jgi:hypothetical protein